MHALVTKIQQEEDIPRLLLISGSPTAFLKCEMKYSMTCYVQRLTIRFKTFRY